MTMECCNAGNMVLSPQRPSTREYSFILLHTINKAERLNAWLGRWGQIPRKVGGKQPVSTVISPAFCSPAGCERGGRRTFFLLFFPPSLSVLVGKTLIGVYRGGQVTSRSFSTRRRTEFVRREGIIISKCQQPWMWGETPR